jgi:6-phosphogluconolactonase
MNFLALVGGLNPGGLVSSFSVSFDGSVLTSVGSSSPAFGSPPAFMSFFNSSLAYVANEKPGAGAGVTSVSLDWKSSTLSATTIGFVPTDEPCAVAVHPSGRYVMSASYLNGTITNMPVDAHGAALPPVATIPLGKNAHDIVFASGGRDVYVPLLGIDTVAALTFDVATGQLTPNIASPGAKLPSGSGPRHLALHPLLPSRAYVICELSNQVITLDRDPATGALTASSDSPQTTLRAGRPTPSLQAAADVLISPDGRYLYASNRATPLGAGDNSIAIFSLDAAGVLSPAFEWADSGINFPRHMDFSPDASILLVANQHAGSISSFARDVSSGTLIQVGAADTPDIAKPSFVWLRAM